MAKHTRTGQVHQPKRSILSGLCTLLVLLGAAGSGGCTRHFFRLRADKEVSHVLGEKDRYPQWQIEQYHVYPDPRARFADPTNPDCPPMPPDDPAAVALSPNPQKPGKAGVTRVSGTGYLELLGYWDAENRRDRPDQEQKPGDAKEPSYNPMPKAEARGQQEDAAVPQANPKVEEPPTLAGACGLPGSTPSRPFLIKLEQASELSLINSRDFQDRREDLYLVALPVTLERFGFAAQFFAIENAVRERTGRQTPEGPHNRWRANGNVGFTKLFSTGALLLFRIANQTVVELTGQQPKHTVSTSTLTLDLIQPLLRGGGKAVTLEPLTQAERNLLYEIRSYARFRKEFYVAIAAGGDIVRGAISPAGFRVNLSTGVAAQTEGYFSVILRSAVLANERKNLKSLQDNQKLFEAYKEGGDYSQLQVDQVELSALNARSTVLNAELLYKDSLDRFKLQLGLPTNLPLELDDTPLRPLLQQIQRFEQIFNQFSLARAEAEGGTIPPAQVRERLRGIFASSAIVQGTRFQAQLPKRWAVWEKLSRDMDSQAVRERLNKLRVERTKLLDAKADLDRDNKPLPEAEQRRLNELDFEIDLGQFEYVLRTYEDQPWNKIVDKERRARSQETIFRDLLNYFVLVLGEARNERVDQIRQSWPELPLTSVTGVDLLKADSEAAQALGVQTALVNRWDLMNARAQLVDAWRLIAVLANSLLGTFDIGYHLESLTPPGQAKPLAFTGSRSRHQLVFNAEAPLIRKQERNQYRASLIGYQRQRRALMATEDAIMATVRTEIRQLRVFAENYIIQKRSVELAYFQVENSLETLQAPTQPPGGQVSGPPGGGGGAGNAAALTNQLLQAQASLVRAQNALYTVWINYLTTRLQLYRDLELLPLDYRGVWIDDLATCDIGAAGQERGAHPDPGPPGTQWPDRGREDGQFPERSAQPQSFPPAEGPRSKEAR